MSIVAECQSSFRVAYPKCFLAIEGCERNSIAATGGEKYWEGWRNFLNESIKMR